MFLGEFTVQFTGQGRVVLPAKFRDNLKGNKEVILSRGMDGCIWGYEKEYWEAQAQKYLEQPITDQQSRNFNRFLFSAAEKVELDEQGRFVIPKSLLTYSQIDKRAIMVGVGDHFEIWQQDRWKKLIEGIEKDHDPSA